MRAQRAKNANEEKNTKFPKLLLKLKIIFPSPKERAVLAKNHKPKKLVEASA